MKLIPIGAFLQRVLPSSHYESTASLLIAQKIFCPRNDSSCVPVSLNYPIDWEASSRLDDRNWRMQLQGWTMFQPIMNFFDEYSNKTEIIGYFFDICRSWFLQYGNDKDDVLTTRMPSSYAWYDQAVGYRALVLSFFINRIKEFNLPIDDNERELLQLITLKHVRHLGNPKVFSLNNHGIFQIHGLVAICNSLVDFEGRSSYLAYGTHQMEKLVTQQFDTSGIHLEHSPQYHFYACRLFQQILDTGWYNDSKTILSRLTAAIRAKRWIVDPMNRSFCIGDSSLLVKERINFEVEKSIDNTALYIVSKFNSAGYAVIRSNWNQLPAKSSMLFITASFHSKSHKHRDCLSFEWFDHGRRIICDSGKYGYRSDKYRNYFLSSRAHNSVEIEGFDILKMSPYGSGIQHIEEVTDNVFKTSCGFSYGAISHQRSLYFSPGNWLLIEDYLDFKRGRAFTQWFHLAPEFFLHSILDRTVQITDSTGQNVYIDCFDEDVLVKSHFGDEEVMQGFVSEMSYQFEKGLAIGFSGNCKQRKIVSLISLGEAERIAGIAYAESISASHADLRVKAKSSPRESILKSVVHHNFCNVKELLPSDGPATYTTKCQKLTFNFYAQCSNRERLLIFLPGATNRKKGSVDFQRYSWCSEMELSCVAFSDPTIQPDNDLSIGWFQGCEGEFAIDGLVEIVNRIIQSLGVPASRVAFFGSSAGGFVGLHLANRFPEALVFAINPQIYLERYTRSFYEKMLGYSYRNYTENEIKHQFRDRLSVPPPAQSRSGRIYIMQNTEDTRHLEKHLTPWLTGIDNTNLAITNLNELADIDEMTLIEPKLLNILLYSDAKAKHAPPGRTESLAVLKLVFRSVNFI